MFIMAISFREFNHSLDQDHSGRGKLKSMEGGGQGCEESLQHWRGGQISVNKHISDFKMHSLSRLLVVICWGHLLLGGFYKQCFVAFFVCYSEAYLSFAPKK